MKTVISGNRYSDVRACVRTHPRRVVELRTFRIILEAKGVRGINLRRELFVRRGKGGLREDVVRDKLFVRVGKEVRGRKAGDLSTVVPFCGTKSESLISVWYEGGKCLE